MQLKLVFTEFDLEDCGVIGEDDFFELGKMRITLKQKDTKEKSWTRQSARDFMHM